MVDLKRRFFIKAAQNKEQALPWIISKDNFFQDCTQCQKCLNACETNIIIKGNGGFPSIDFNLGECTFCYACAESCPEDLFLSQDEIPWKQQIDISQHCLAKNQVECRSCEDNCEPQAIKFRLQPQSAAQPILDSDKCTGCGGCISSCPTNAISMIFTTNDN